MTSERGKNKEGSYEPQACNVLVFLPRLDVLGALSEYAHTVKWNPFVYYIFILLFRLKTSLTSLYVNRKLL